MLSTLQLVAIPAAQLLADTLVVIKDMYRKQSRKVPAPLEFVQGGMRVLTGSTMNFVRSASLRGRCAPGNIWVESSRHYKNFDDYLIP